jgi:hypothetical protein
MASPEATNLTSLDEAKTRKALDVAEALQHAANPGSGGKPHYKEELATVSSVLRGLGQLELTDSDRKVTVGGVPVFDNSRPSVLIVLEERILAFDKSNGDVTQKDLQQFLKANLGEGSEQSRADFRKAFLEAIAKSPADAEGKARQLAMLQALLRFDMQTDPDKTYHDTRKWALRNVKGLSMSADLPLHREMDDYKKKYDSAKGDNKIDSAPVKKAAIEFLVNGDIAKIRDLKYIATHYLDHPKDFDTIANEAISQAKERYGDASEDRVQAIIIAREAVAKTAQLKKYNPHLNHIPTEFMAGGVISKETAEALFGRLTDSSVTLTALGYPGGIGHFSNGTRKGKNGRREELHNVGQYVDNGAAWAYMYACWKAGAEIPLEGDSRNPKSTNSAIRSQDAADICEGCSHANLHHKRASLDFTFEGVSEEKKRVFTAKLEEAGFKNNGKNWHLGSGEMDWPHWDWDPSAGQKALVLDFKKRMIAKYGEPAAVETSVYKYATVAPREDYLPETASKEPPRIVSGQDTVERFDAQDKHDKNPVIDSSLNAYQFFIGPKSSDSQAPDAFISLSKDIGIIPTTFTTAGLHLPRLVIVNNGSDLDKHSRNAKENHNPEEGYNKYLMGRAPRSNEIVLTINAADVTSPQDFDKMLARVIEETAKKDEKLQALLTGGKFDPKKIGDVEFWNHSAGYIPWMQEQGSEYLKGHNQSHYMVGAIFPGNWKYMKSWVEANKSHLKDGSKRFVALFTGPSAVKDNLAPYLRSMRGQFDIQIDTETPNPDTGVFSQKGITVKRWEVPGDAERLPWSGDKHHLIMLRSAWYLRPT